jgi:hypothetical protein
MTGAATIREALERAAGEPTNPPAAGAIAPLLATGTPAMTILESGIRAAERAVAMIPPDRRGAAAIVFDDQGAKIGAAVRIRGQWHLSAELTQKLRRERPAFRFIIDGSW